MKNACSATWSYSPSQILVKASIVSRARRIQRFLSQNTYVAKQFTGIEGSTVPVKDTIEAFNKIADGDYDHVAEQAFFMCGGLDDVEAKWAEIQKSL